MLEVEQKFRVSDHAAVRAALARLGAAPGDEHAEADHYFNAPDRDFALTGEAFRLRRVGDRNVLTYKGPKHAGPVKTRPEIELAVAPGEAGAATATALLAGLGYRPVAVVRKARATFGVVFGDPPVTVCLDTVERVGTFVEVEAMAAEGDADAARSAVQAVAAELGLTDPEPRSYLRMLLEGGGVSVPVASTIAQVRAAVAAARAQGHRVGFVPTMGALHAGHAALVRAAAERCGFVVTSVFVNPTQFGPTEDLARYPRTLEADRDMVAAAGGHLLFAPTVEEMYPPASLTHVDVDRLGDTLCGPRRPGHFRGVCTVVLKLLNIVRPDLAVFGAKDAQQARIVRRMVCDLDVPVELVVADTVREPDGLAMSSRNRYLSPAERAAAPAIYRALLAVRERSRTVKDVATLEAGLRADLEAIPGARVDYADIVDDEDLQPVARLDRPALAAVAVHLGTTRLIDNVTLG